MCDGIGQEETKTEVKVLEEKLEELLTRVLTPDIIVGMLCVERQHQLLYNPLRIMHVFHTTRSRQDIPERFQKPFETMRFDKKGLSPWSDQVESALVFMGLYKGVWWTCGERPDYLHLEDKWVSHYLNSPELRDLSSKEREFLIELAAQING